MMRLFEILDLSESIILIKKKLYLDAEDVEVKFLVQNLQVV